MKILFVSDIHGSFFYLEKLEREFIDSNKIILLGDFMYHGPRNPLPQGYNPAKVSEFLNKYKNKIIAVRGNCDSEVDQMLLEFPMMADYSALEVDGVNFFLTHGHIYSPKKHLELPENTVFCSGHTHIPVLDKSEQIFYFNCGSIALPKAGFENSYGIYQNGYIEIKNFSGGTIKKIQIK